MTVHLPVCPASGLTVLLWPGLPGRMWDPRVILEEPTWPWGGGVKKILLLLQRPSLPGAGEGKTAGELDDLNGGGRESKFYLSV